MADPITPDPDAASIRTSCSQKLVLSLAEVLNVSANCADDVLKAAIKRIGPPKKQGLALWQEHA